MTARGKGLHARLIKCAVDVTQRSSPHSAQRVPRRKYCPHCSRQAPTYSVLTSVMAAMRSTESATTLFVKLSARPDVRLLCSPTCRDQSCLSVLLPRGHSCSST